MWQTGTISTFASRLHQLPTGTQDLITGFYLEGKNYTGINYTGINFMGSVYTGNNLNQNIKWNREFNMQYYRFTRDDSMLSTGRWFY